MMRLLLFLTSAVRALTGAARRAPGVGRLLAWLDGLDATRVGNALAAAPAAVLRRPRPAAVLMVAVVMVSVLAVTRIEAGAPPSLLAEDGAEVSQATDKLERRFGGEPIVVMVRGDIGDVLTRASLERLNTLESELAGLEGVRSVSGPGSFVTETVEQINTLVGQELGTGLETANAAADRASAAAKRRGASPAEQKAAGDEARSAALGSLRERYEGVTLRYGSVGQPSLDNADFLASLVLGSSTEPKERFGWVFADRTHSIIAVRPQQGLSDARLRQLGRSIQRKVDETKIPELSFVVGGSSLVVASLTAELSKELPRISPAALLAMALVLLIGLGVAWRSLATLLPAAIAVLLTTALGWLLGLGLTPATIAALPVVLGLTIDYAVQLQARYRGQRGGGMGPAEAARAATVAVGPTLLLAASVMLVGFLTLTISTVPLVDRLGFSMALGVVCGLTTAILLTGPLLTLRDRGVAPPPELRVPRLRIPRPLRIPLLVLAVVLPVAGLAVAQESKIQSDITKLAPDSMPALQAVETLQRELGTAGQLRIAVSSSDLSNPEVIRWMSEVQKAILEEEPRLTPGPNVADLILSGAGAQELSPARVRRLLAIVPPYFRNAAISVDLKFAEISFGMPLLPAEEQAEIIEDIQPLLDGAPAGTTATPGGIVALSAASVTALENGRPWLLLGAAFVIFLLLLRVRRRLDRAIIPLLPALVTVGISSLLVVLADIRLSPLSAGLEPLVLAVGVEFGLLLEARYREARDDGHDPAAASDLARRLVGAPVAIAAATVAAGFAVLGASRLGVLQQFGLLAAGELLFCATVAVLLVTPLAAAWDRRRARQPARAPSPRPRITAG